MRLIAKLVLLLMLAGFSHVAIEVSYTVATSIPMYPCNYFGEAQAEEYARAERALASRSFITQWVMKRVLDLPVTVHHRPLT